MSRRTPLALLLVLAATGCSMLEPIPGTKLVYRRIKPEVAFYMLRDSPDALILDLRPAGSPTQQLAELGRVRSLPLAELPARAAELEPYRERTFLVYCGGDPQCGLAAMRRLVENGCVHAVLIDGPLDGWETPATAGGEVAVADAGAAMTEADAEPAPAAAQTPSIDAEVEASAAAVEPESPAADAWSPWL
jgi:rhodanese-related sulfurtransferase